MTRIVLFLCVGLLATACSDDLSIEGSRSQGVAESARQGGPLVVYDLLAKPLPEIPLPNDQATRLDPTSVTGRRLNVSLNASTEHERRARAKFDRLSGFGTYAPIMVSFDKALALGDLKARHGNDDFTDDAIFLLNIDPDCGRYGEEVALDLGRGRFPVTLYKRDSMTLDPEAPGGYRIGKGNRLFENDPSGIYNNYLFPEHNEPDLNGDGRLDPEEDVDQDGVRDVANFIDPAACDEWQPERCAASCDDDECFQACLVTGQKCVADNLLTWYERESNTLILRGVWPLEQRCQYAVVLTKRLTGEDGRAVESPFPGVNPRPQTQALEAVPSLLDRYGLGREDIAFAWTFTTGDMTGDIESLRAGLYGHGPFAQLSTEFPVTGLETWTLGELSGTDNAATSLNGACGGGALALFWNLGLGEWSANLCSLEADLSSVGRIFGGSFKAPYLLADRDGIATEAYPSDEDETWIIDPQTGEIEYGTAEVPFWCSLPREAEDCEPGNPENRPFCKPFPTVLYAHGYGSARSEIMGHMGRHAAMGQALCALDGPGHGGNWMKFEPDIIESFELGDPFFQQYNATSLPGLLRRGRDRDLNNDGFPDPGGDMWSADLFHTRDMVRQTMVEYMQFIRILRSFGQDGGLLGDFSGDDRTDIGGRDGTIGLWGISLGGVISGVMAGAEPSLDAVSPNAGGAGLTDIAVRSAQAGVPQAVVLPMVSPTLVGCLPVDAHQRPLPADQEAEDNCLGTGAELVSGGSLRLGMYLNDVANLRRVPVGRIEGVEVGDRVLFENLSNGEQDSAYIGPRGRFRVAVAADALGPILRRPILGLNGDEPGPVRIEDPTRFGDSLSVTIYVGQTDTVRGTLTTWGQDVTFQGTTYPEGTQLVALQDGFGFRRNTPGFRRFMALAQTGVNQADPAVWGTHSFLEPLEFPYDPNGRTRGGQTRVLIMPTAGDKQVPVNTGVAMGRVSGLFGSWKRDPSLPKEYGWRELFVPDARYGTSIDQYLIDTWAVEGDGALQRYPDNPYNPNAIFDVDNVSDGRALFTCGDSDWSAKNGENECPDALRGSGPECSEDTDCGDASRRCVAGLCEQFFPIPAPEAGGLRLNVARSEGSFDAFRLPVLRPAGQHGIYNAQAFRDFDADAYMVNFTIRFLGSKGAQVDHVEGCDCAASRLPNITIRGVRQTPAHFLQRAAPACVESDLKVCDAACAEAWGIVTPEESQCTAD